MQFKKGPYYSYRSGTGLFCKQNLSHRPTNLCGSSERNERVAKNKKPRFRSFWKRGFGLKVYPVRGADYQAFNEV